MARRSVVAKHTEADHIRKMSDPDSWPVWPYLPIKNTKTQTMGVLVDTGAAPLKVFLINLYDIANEHGGLTDATPFEIYDNAMAAVVDGWVVD